MIRNKIPDWNHAIKVYDTHRNLLLTGCPNSAKMAFDLQMTIWNDVNTVSCNYVLYSLMLTVK